MKLLKVLFLSLFIITILLAGTVFVIVTFYKKQLSDMMVAELNQRYGLNLTVQDVDVSFLGNWPHASVELKSVLLSPAGNRDSTAPLVRAGAVALSFDIEKMLKRNFELRYLTIRDAEISLIKNTDGTKNFVIKRPSQDSVLAKLPQRVSEDTNTMSFALDKVTLKNCRFRYLNRQREQNIDLHFDNSQFRLKQFADGTSAKVKGDIKVAGLLFHAGKGEFLKNSTAEIDLTAFYMYESKTLCVHQPSIARIEDIDYKVTAILGLADDKRISLVVEGKDVDFDKANRLLTDKMRKVLSNFEVQKPFDAKVLLSAPIGRREDPIVIVDVRGENHSLSIGQSKIPYSDLSFRGRIISLHSSKTRGEIEKARVIFDSVSGKVYDFPFSAVVTVTNLTNPFINIDAYLHVEGQKINFAFAKNYLIKGSAGGRIHYSGPTAHLNSKEFLDKPMKLSANLTFRDLSYKERKRPYEYIINGKAQLNNRFLKFEDLKLQTIVGEATLKGKADNFVQYVLGYTNKFTAALAARTESLNMNPLMQLWALQTMPEENETRAERKAERKAARKDRNLQAEVKNNIEKKVGQDAAVDININLFARNMSIRSVKAKQVHADLHYGNNVVTIKSVNLNTCDGRIHAKGKVKDFKEISSDISVENVDVTRLFSDFENFGQQAVQSENLQGRLSFDARFSTELDEKMEIRGETMDGIVKLTLKEGHLLNFAPVQNLSNFLFRNRDFNDVAFSELNETFQIKGYKMKIEELEIGSSVLDLYVVDGLYDFKGTSTVNVLVPWNNLKRRKKDYQPAVSGQSAENTKGVKVNFTGPSNNLKVSLGHRPIDPLAW